MNNLIAYVASKIKTMAHSMILKKRISCVLGISIFGFKTYRKQWFNLIEIQTTSTSKQFLQAETLNGKKNGAYDQQYNAKQLRDLHKQAMMKQKNYENMLVRLSGMYFFLSLVPVTGTR